MGIAKMTCIHAQYHEVFWLKFRIHAKFREKKIIFFEYEFAISSKIVFVLSSAQFWNIYLHEAS